MWVNNTNSIFASKLMHLEVDDSMVKIYPFVQEEEFSKS